MTITELERKIEEYVVASRAKVEFAPLIVNDQLHVLKYMPAEYLENTIDGGRLYASERAGFTWGDAMYVAPVAFPLCTMMYGEVGVVGTYATATQRFFDASDPVGIRLYQEWITFQTVPYLELTTTVHANIANRNLRNDFRTRFHVDCVFFRPDEVCPDYVDGNRDWWLAITHWDAHRCVGHGFSDAVRHLKWCVVVPDAFKADGRGYAAQLYKGLASRHTCTPGRYSTLAADINAAYGAPRPQVVVCDFS